MSVYRILFPSWHHHINVSSFVRVGFFGGKWDYHNNTEHGRSQMKVEGRWLRSPEFQGLSISGESLVSRLLPVRLPYSPTETVSGTLEFSDAQSSTLAVGLLWPVPIPFSYGWIYAVFSFSPER